MNKSAFKATYRLLKRAGLRTPERRYDRQSFGSWLIELSSRPPLRVVWDGKDGWLILQEKTEETFNDLPVWKDLKVVKEERLQTPENALSLVSEALPKSDKSVLTLERLSEHDSFRRMVADAAGGRYTSYSSLDEARDDPDAVVVLEGDDGGQIYAVIPVSDVRCSMNALERLLADLDAIAWPGNPADMKHIYFERQPTGSGIPGGMGGAASTGQIWIHDEFRKMGLTSEIEQVLAGSLDHIRTSGRERDLP